MNVQVFLRMNTWMFETCRTQYNLFKSLLKQCAFCWFLLHRYITTYGSKDVNNEYPFASIITYWVHSSESGVSNIYLAQSQSRYCGPIRRPRRRGSQLATYLTALTIVLSQRYTWKLHMMPRTAGWTPIIHGVHVKPSALPLRRHEAELSVVTNGSTMCQKRNGIE